MSLDSGSGLPTGSSVSNDRRGDAALRSVVRAMADETGAEVFLRQTKAIMGRADSRPTLSTIACPTLVLVGDGDVLTPPALAQERQCLVVFAAAYRPNLNRWNRLGERAGENALFQQYREIFLAPLDADSAQTMLTKLGLLRGIQWTPASPAPSSLVVAGSAVLVERRGLPAARMEDNP